MCVYGVCGVSVVLSVPLCMCVCCTVYPSVHIH